MPRLQSAEVRQGRGSFMFSNDSQILISSARTIAHRKCDRMGRQVSGYRVHYNLKAHGTVNFVRRSMYEMTHATEVHGPGSHFLIY
jgi:hypothetical protein